MDRKGSCHFSTCMPLVNLRRHLISDLHDKERVPSDHGQDPRAQSIYERQSPLPFRYRCHWYRSRTYYRNITLRRARHQHSPLLFPFPAIEIEKMIYILPQPPPRRLTSQVFQHRGDSKPLQGRRQCHMPLRTLILPLSVSPSDSM